MIPLVLEPMHMVADAPPPGAVPRFPGAHGALARHWVLRGDDAPLRARALLARGAIERAWVAMRPAPPPWGDLPPATPTFHQAWRAAFPAGLGLSTARAWPADIGPAGAWAWPGGRGENVTVVVIEYSWDPTHEELLGLATAPLGGVPDATWAFHGTGVLGILAAGDNDFGVTGAAPLADVLVQHPYFEVGAALEYDVARAVVEATAALSAGDILLIEQQVYGPDDEYLPVSYDGGVRDAIRAATTAGIVVIEPAGNDDQDLDDPTWEGAFLDDTGVIRVGGGSSSFEPVPRFRSASNHGSAVHVQAWSDGIVTCAGPPYTDLFYPEEDPRQAYTSSFAGTSGAAALVAGLAAVLQSTSLAVRGEPLTATELRAALVSAGWAQADGSPGIGPLPDGRRMLRTWMVP
ncbi:MAG: hypothetical protein EXR71_18175 [Myxococcales bacterium]|nr:hypothetical protein [Myxococcales bacterium]